MNVDRVNISDKAIDSALRTTPSETNAQAVASPQPRPYGDDALEISDTGRNVARLSQAIEQSHAQRLAQVQAAVASGTYRVSGKDIAMSMIDLNSE